MNNKVCINLIVPILEARYNVFVPVNKKTIEIIFLLNKAISNMTNDSYKINNQSKLINADTGVIYDVNLTIKENDIMNSSTLILL